MRAYFRLIGTPSNRGDRYAFNGFAVARGLFSGLQGEVTNRELSHIPRSENVGFIPGAWEQFRSSNVKS